MQRKVVFLLSSPLSKKALSADPLRIQTEDSNAKGEMEVWWCALARAEKKLKHLGQQNLHKR